LQSMPPVKAMLRAGRNAQLGLGPVAGGEVVAAVDHSGGEGAVLEDGTHARAPGAEPEKGCGSSPMRLTKTRAGSTSWSRPA
jgi:hypothetical protein